MRNLIIGALFALGLVACTAAATVYVTEEDHAHDIAGLQGQITELQYRLYIVELAVFPPEATFDNGAPR